MDDKLFFDTILPSTGLRCVAVPRPDGKFNHRFGPDNAWLAQACQHLDGRGATNVYFACSSYIMDTRRKQSNVDKVRSFWVDLDVGPAMPGKPPKYATQRDAAAAIMAFATAIGLPLPLLVNSGWGVHAYWPTTADMEPRVWKTIAQALKRALTAMGVLFDPTRTADEASVLRPPLTFNRKAQPKMVKVVRWCAQIDLAIIIQALLPWAAQAPAADPFAHLGPAPAGVALAGSDLTAGVGYDPSSALLIADSCGVMAMMRDTRGKLDQPTWYNALGVLAHTTEAPDICHEWSKGDPRYTAAEVDAKLSQLSNHGPTTCDKLGEQWPDVCRACPHFGKIKSPIVLGRPRIEAVAVEPQTKGFAKATAAEISLPYGYGVQADEKGRMLTYTRIVEKDGEKVRETEVISDTFFMAITRLWVDDAAHIEWEAETREGPHIFVTPANLIGKGGREVLGELAANEIMPRPGKERQVESYLKGWIGHLKNTAEQVMAHRSFGWNGERFVLGDMVLEPDGSTSRAVLIGETRRKADVVAAGGDLKTWVALVDRAYNAPGQEAFQFQIGCAFAAPLLSLMNQVNGVTVYAHSAGSGVGKTTVQRVGLSVWGYWKDMMLAQNKATQNALWALLGAYNTLPVVYDELTNAPNAEVSELVFSVSSGRPKERMSGSGELRSNNASWSTILLASGNTKLSEKLALHRSNAEAEMARLFEFTLEADPHLGVLEANTLFQQFDENYGHAGQVFAQYITANRAKVTAYLNRMQAKLVTELEFTQMERHWSALFAAVIVALHLCRALKLLRFEVQPVQDWMTLQMERNRDQKTELVATPEDLIGYMLNDLWDGVLVTTGEGDRRASVIARVDKHPREALIGRAINPLQSNDPPQLIISRAAIGKWASAKGVSASDMFDKAVTLGWCKPGHDRYAFGKGTIEYPSTNTAVPAWRFNVLAMSRGAGAQVVQQLMPMQGGKQASGKP